MFPPAVTISANRSSSMPFSAASRAEMRSRSSGMPSPCWYLCRAGSPEKRTSASHTRGGGRRIVHDALPQRNRDPGVRRLDEIADPGNDRQLHFRAIRRETGRHGTISRHY